MLVWSGSYVMYLSSQPIDLFQRWFFFPRRGFPLAKSCVFVQCPFMYVLYFSFDPDDIAYDTSSRQRPRVSLTIVAIPLFGLYGQELL